MAGDGLVRRAKAAGLILTPMVGVVGVLIPLVALYHTWGGTKAQDAPAPTQAQTVTINLSQTLGPALVTSASGGAVQDVQSREIKPTDRPEEIPASTAAMDHTAPAARVKPSTALLISPATDEPSDRTSAQLLADIFRSHGYNIVAGGGDLIIVIGPVSYPEPPWSDGQSHRIKASVSVSAITKDRTVVIPQKTVFASAENAEFIGLKSKARDQVLLEAFRAVSGAAP